MMHFWICKVFGGIFRVCDLGVDVRNELRNRAFCKSFATKSCRERLTTFVRRGDGRGGGDDVVFDVGKAGAFPGGLIDGSLLLSYRDHVEVGTPDYDDAQEALSLAHGVTEEGIVYS